MSAKSTALALQITAALLCPEEVHGNEAELNAQEQSRDTPLSELAKIPRDFLRNVPDR